MHLWDAKWKSDWEDYAAILCSELEIHHMLGDAIAEYCMRRKHAGDDKYYQFSAEAFEHLTQTLQKVEANGELRHLKADRDVIQSLTPEERDLFFRVAQQLFPDQSEALTRLQNPPREKQQKQKKK